MNILILTPYLPYPLNSGGAQGMFNMIDNLRHKHHYTMVISEGSDYKPENKEALQQLWPEVDIIIYPLWQQMLCWSFLYERTRRVLLKKVAPKSRQLAVEMAVRPYGEWFSKHHVRFVHDIIARKQIDLVQVEFYECLPWCHHLPSGVKKVFVHHELGFVRKERLLKGIRLTEKEQRQLEAEKKREFADLEEYDAVITVTETDKKVLQQEGLRTPVYVSTSAINTPSYPYSVTERQLTFLGSYAHLPNREGMEWFLGEVAPLLAEERLTLNLVGNAWPQNYARNEHMEVLLKGFVPNLPDVVLGNIMIVPILSGSGMRMKILEAAAMSLPIVTTTVGVEGLDFVDGESCLVADTPADFAAAVKRLCHDLEFRRTLGENANRVFAAKFHPSVLAEQRNHIYQLLCP